MSFIEYRNLLYETSQQINWLSEGQRLLFSCKGLIAEGSETSIQHALALFEKLEAKDNLGIDRLEVLKDLLRPIGKWNLLERIEMFEIKREEFNRLLEHISRALDESGHLERLVSICRGKIAEDRASNIKDARTLLKELEKNNNLAIGRLDILKILIGADEPDLLQQVEEFEKKRKQEDDVEATKRRRKDRAVAVFSSVRYAGQRLIGTVTPYCTFRNVAGGIVVVTTLTILRRSTSLEEFVSSFTEAVLPAANTLRAISDGSVCFTIQAENSLALEALWKHYQEGTLQKKLQEFLVTDEIRQLAGGEEVTLTVDIDEEEYQNACSDLKIIEIQALSSENNDRSLERNGRNTGPAIMHVTQKENEVSSVLSKLNLAEAQTASQQEKIKLQEKEIMKLKEELEEAKAFRQITEEASDTKRADALSRLKKRRNSDSVLYCPKKHEDTKYSDGKSEEVKEWERSAFVWKMGRYFENLPETFRESSEMSDSGVSTQSVFSELESEEGKGSTTYSKPAKAYPPEGDGNELEGEKINTDKRSREERKAAYAENLARQLHYGGDPFQAIENYQKVLVIRRNIKDRRGEAVTSMNMGNAYYALRNFSKARECVQKALMISTEIGDKHVEAMAYCVLGSVYSALGDFHKAKEHSQKALMINKDFEDRLVELIASNNLGYVYSVHGDFRKAIEYSQKALMINKDIGSKSVEAMEVNNLGYVYSVLGDFRKAIEYFQKSLMISTEIGDKNGEATAYGNLGNAHTSLGDFHKAREYLEKALMIKRGIGDKSGEATACGNLGYVYHILGDYTRAMASIERAIMIKKEIEDKEKPSS